LELSYLDRRRKDVAKGVISFTRVQGRAVEGAAATFGMIS